MTKLSIAAAGGLLVAAVLVTIGCEQAGSGGRPPEAQAGQAAMQGAAADGETAPTPAWRQTTCPVMGGPVNSDIYVDHQGQRVHFCCQGCVQAFQNDPERYVEVLRNQGLRTEG